MGYCVPQQHPSSASQATEHSDDLLHHQVPVALQALLYMEEARRASVLRGDKEDNDKQVHHKEYGCRAGGR